MHRPIEILVNKKKSCLHIIPKKTELADGISVDGLEDMVVFLEYCLAVNKKEEKIWCPKR